MRGEEKLSDGLFSYVRLDDRVAKNHPLRLIRELVESVISSMSGRFGALYSHTGRPSIPPEQLLKALLLQAFFSLRSERQLMEQLDYNLLFRWFVGLPMDAGVWDATTFCKNRDRLLEGDVAREFLAGILNETRVKRLLSSDHFSVDGTLVEAWASMKSFRAKDENTPSDQGGGRNGDVDLSGHAERNAALAMIEPLADRPGAITLGADRGYDAEDFVNELRAMNVRPHVAQNTSGRRSAIDHRTTRHKGYAASIRIRKRIEEAFGWIKTIAGQRKTKFRGVERVGWAFTLAAAAYNLIRIPKLLAAG